MNNIDINNLMKFSKSLYFVQYIITKYLNGTIEVCNTTYHYRNKQYIGAKFDIEIFNKKKG